MFNLVKMSFEWLFLGKKNKLVEYLKCNNYKWWCTLKYHICTETVFIKHPLEESKEKKNGPDCVDVHNLLKRGEILSNLQSFAYMLNMLSLNTAT